MKSFYFLIIFIIILLFFNYTSFEDYSNKKYKGVCAFDIDGTVISGSKNTCQYNGKKYDKKNGGCTLAAIKACQDKDFAIAVNTASFRDRKSFCCEVGMCEKGNKGKCLVKENNWWNNDKYNEKNEKCGSNHGGCGKAYIMKKLYNSNNLSEPRTSVLWDDYHSNISAAYTAGWGVIPMPNLKNCSYPIGNGKHDKGIQQHQIDSFLNDSYKKWKPCRSFTTTNCSDKPCSKSTWYSQHYDPGNSF